ncbi:hypothetical protein [Sphingomonas sp. BK481]|uniref:hypothetical protein n=1 Tax=Sphingomonas sp. BK481 TaxID=2586981 RepID=UPI00161B296A|nr:hypothetical protein [Sphingomonas sp. BK481]MBB3587767.1 hypothetical protein [Sphingomonas sp. BK481]
MLKSTLTALAVVLATSACANSSRADNTSDDATPPVSNASMTANTSAMVSQPEPSSVVPKGWAIQWSAGGDLNGDAVPDQVLILKRVGASVDGPRRLLIAFGKPDGTKSIAADTDTFLPVVENETDPFASDNPLQIKNRSLRVYVEGTGTDLTHETFTFRYQNAKFELIGYDAVNQMRSTGDYDNESINYSTGNVEHTVGNIAQSKDVVTKTQLRAGRRPTLLSINLTEGFSPPDDEI